MSASTTLGDYFRVRKEKGEPGLPTLSVTMNDGLVDRADLDRKMETNLAPEAHLRVREGDIAYNMMRMWQGASGRAEKDGIVSPHMWLSNRAITSTAVLRRIGSSRRG